MRIPQKFSQQVSNPQTTKNKKVNRKAKNEKVSSRGEKSQISKALADKKEIQDHEELAGRDSSKPSNIRSIIKQNIKQILICGKKIFYFIYNLMYSFRKARNTKGIEKYC